jgi:hypothetical protein
MNKLLLVILVLTMAIFTGGCTFEDRITETVYLKDAVTEDITAETINSQNVTSVGLNTDNATIATLILESLPTVDPGIHGAVWSDNGTLRISP